MTVGEKSAILGYDLGQKVLNSGIKIKKYLENSTFMTYKIEGAIPADDNQRGSKKNIYYFCSKRVSVDETVSQNVRNLCLAFDGSTENKADIENAYKLWLAEQQYEEKATNQIDEVL